MINLRISKMKTRGGGLAAASNHVAVLPPLILTIWPVMKDALFEARNTMASAISSGFAPRLSGTEAKKAAVWSGVPVRRSSIAVSVGPGATTLTRTPKGAADAGDPTGDQHDRRAHEIDSL